MIGQAAMAHLPVGLPAFLSTSSARDEIVYLQAEEDRLKIGEDSDVAWSREWNTDHYLDIGDDGRVAGVLAMGSLPQTRDDYILALEHASPSVDPYNVGFLPYSILEGYEQVRADFALWRSASASERPERERLAIHDIGIFSHFVGDGSQPLHVSVHYNGWGKYPNPNGYTDARDTHAEFESDFVDKFVALDAVRPLVGPAKVLPAIPFAEIQSYLMATDSQAMPFYDLQKAGGFVLTDSTSAAHAKAVAFTAARLAAGAQMLDSLILTAWQSSADLKDTN